jgi:hypothetical protein
LLRVLLMSPATFELFGWVGLAVWLAIGTWGLLNSK